MPKSVGNLAAIVAAVVVAPVLIILIASVEVPVISFPSAIVYYQVTAAELLEVTTPVASNRVLTTVISVPIFY